MWTEMLVNVRIVIGVFWREGYHNLSKFDSVAKILNLKLQNALFLILNFKIRRK